MKILLAISIVAALIVTVVLLARRRARGDRDALETAILLAAVSSDQLVEHHRVVTFAKSAQVYRRYVVGAGGSNGVSEEEAKTLLGVERPKRGAPLELFSDNVDLCAVLLSLLDPEKGGLARLARTLGRDESSVREQLATSGVDLAGRTIGGRNWCQLPIENQWQPFEVVETVTQSYGQLSLRHAKLLCPEKALGEEIKFPPLGTVIPEWFQSRADLERKERGLTIIAPSFERARPLLQPVATPSSLVSFGLPPLRRLYPEDHGVLFVDIPGSTAEKLWKRLDRDRSTTGYHPVILGGPPSELVDGMLAWTQDDMSGLQAGSHAMDSPESVLREVEKVDVKKLLASGGNPSYPELSPQRGEWPEKGEGKSELEAVRDLRTGEYLPVVRLALIKTDAAWKTVAYLPMLTLAGEATASLAQVCAVTKYWEEKWDARVISLRPATIEWFVGLPPGDRDNALAAAIEHFTFTPEGGAEILEHRAAELQRSRWYAWWD